MSSLAHTRPANRSVAAVALENSVSMYPNPTQGSVIFFNTEAQDMDVTLFSSEGKCLIERKRLKNKQELKMDELNAGTYFVCIRIGDKVLYKKLIRDL